MSSANVMEVPVRTRTLVWTTLAVLGGHIATVVLLGSLTSQIVRPPIIPPPLQIEWINVPNAAPAEDLPSAPVSSAIRARTDLHHKPASAAVPAESAAAVKYPELVDTQPVSTQPEQPSVKDVTTVEPEPQRTEHRVKSTDRDKPQFQVQEPPDQRSPPPAPPADSQRQQAQPIIGEKSQRDQLPEPVHAGQPVIEQPVRLQTSPDGSLAQQQQSSNSPQQSLPAVQSTGSASSQPVKPSISADTQPAQFAEQDASWAKRPNIRLTDPLARLARQQQLDRLTVQLNVAVDGRITAVNVIESSGHAGIDRYITQQLRQGRLQPFKRHGVAVAGVVILPIRIN